MNRFHHHIKALEAAGRLESTLIRHIGEGELFVVALPIHGSTDTEYVLCRMRPGPCSLAYDMLTPLSGGDFLPGTEFTHDASPNDRCYRLGTTFGDLPLGALFYCGGGMVKKSGPHSYHELPHGAWLSVDGVDPGMRVLPVAEQE